MSNLPSIHPLARSNAIKHPVIILVWHDIIRRDKLVWFDTAIAEFERQVARLIQAGAVPITISSLYRYLKDGTPTPPPGACVFCFDDNTVGIRDFAMPRLAKHGFPFVVSAHTAYIGRITSKAHNSYSALREIEQAGGTVVSQTHTHPPDLRLLSDAALAKEFTESKRRIEEGMAHTVSYVTYPSGKWDRRVAESAARAGYVLGLTEDFGPAELSPHLMGIHRYSTHRRFTEGLQAIARAHRTP